MPSANRLSLFVSNYPKEKSEQRIAFGDQRTTNNHQRTTNNEQPNKLTFPKSRGHPR